MVGLTMVGLTNNRSTCWQPGLNVPWSGAGEPLCPWRVGLGARLWGKVGGGATGSFIEPAGPHRQLLQWR